MPNTVRVSLGARSYDVRIGTDLLAHAGTEIAPFLHRPRAFVITDENVATFYLPTVKAALARADIGLRSLVLPPGEGTKSWAALQRTVDWLLGEKVERGDVVVALGGGVIGDLAGFAAAITLRGLRLIQMPTSLLAQVDSSVGGKTGIDTEHGKNLVGAFHQPALVLADIGALDSLAPQEFLAGYGEVVKYGLLGDPVFFSWLEVEGPRLLHGDRAARLRAVTRSVEMKARIVERDETEAGERALLNLGHTFGHALERATGYSDRLLHGEGVAIGTVLAFRLSERLGLCPQGTTARIIAHFRAMHMRVEPAEIPGPLPDARTLIAAMAQDKKVRDGRMRFILARDIGAAFITADVPEEAVQTLLDEALRPTSGA